MTEQNNTPQANAVEKRTTKSNLKKIDTFLFGDAGVKGYVQDAIRNQLIPMALNTAKGFLHKLIDDTIKTNSSQSFNLPNRQQAGTGSANLTQYNKPVSRNTAKTSKTYPTTVSLDSYQEAVDVLDALKNDIRTLGAARVNHYYGYVGIPSEYTDSQYGWHDLSTASVVPAQGGKYNLVLPTVSRV